MTARPPQADKEVSRVLAAVQALGLQVRSVRCETVRRPDKSVHMTVLVSVGAQDDEPGIGPVDWRE